MQPYQRTLSTVTATALVLVAVLSAHADTAQAQTTPIKFGMDLSSVDTQTAAGIKPDYAMLWVGPWMLTSGFGSLDTGLQKAKARGVTPLIQFYYWGNDISPTCYANGCYSNIHKTWKDQAGWSKLATKMVERLNVQMGGKPVAIIMETEFNKGGMSRSESLDQGLADKSWYIRNHYSAAQIILGFGNWGRSDWGTFDRAAGASHYIGVQGMRASTRDSLASFQGLPYDLLGGARDAKAKFGKPVFVHDFAASSHWEPEYLKHQAGVVSTLFKILPDLKAAGVKAIVYRSLFDSPGATTAEYYGEAERHFGFRWASSSELKPAYHAWRNGVLTERNGAPAAPPPASSTSGFTSVPAWGSVFTEVERFSYRPVGGALSYSSASAGQAWNIWSNGWIKHGYTLAEGGTYEIRTIARGTRAEGVAPHMEVRVDGKTITWADPGASQWYQFTGKTWLAKGPHEVTIHFTNDKRTSTEDRNLWVDRVEFKRVA